MDTAPFNPLVSIVIPVYNGADYLREALESALSQTYANCEIIVVNDGSTDGGTTENIARSYGSRICYIAKPNGGVASALNAGIREMKGDYFSWLSHDDAYHPEKIAAQVDYLAGNDRSVILFSDYEYIDELSRLTKKRRLPKTEPAQMRIALLTRDPVNGCTTLIPRECFDKIGFFDERLRTIQDYDLWFRLAKVYRFHHMSQVLLKSRVHSGQGSLTIRSHYEECSAFFIRAFQELSPDEIRGATGEALAVAYARHAVRMKLRGFTEVSEFLLGLSEKLAADAGFGEQMKRTALSLICHSLTKKIKPTYWIRRIRNGSVS